MRFSRLDTLGHALLYLFPLPTPCLLAPPLLLPYRCPCAESFRYQPVNLSVLSSLYVSPVSYYKSFCSSIARSLYRSTVHVLSGPLLYSITAQSRKLLDYRERSAQAAQLCQYAFRLLSPYIITSNLKRHLLCRQIKSPIVCRENRYLCKTCCSLSYCLVGSTHTPIPINITHESYGSADEAQSFGRRSRHCYCRCAIGNINRKGTGIWEN